ncbi:MAG: amidophosphoribosyltransferase [Nitrospinota bacterium]|nr:amidophosphoribosyltransferase [Nitrospinota bacterium]
MFSEKKIRKLTGSMAIGHNRYSTAGCSDLKNAQPCIINYSKGHLALAHNGNLINANLLRAKLEEGGSIFNSTMDSEVIVHLIAKSKENSFSDGVASALEQVKGAYSLVAMTEKELVAVRDPRGFRPLSLGRISNTKSNSGSKDAYIVASETCAMDLIEAEYIRDIEPGEMILINENGVQSFKPFKEETLSFCIFEFIYFSRPDSNIFGKNVHSVREKFGEILAEEAPVDADIVIPVPDSGIVAALGYAKKSGIPFEMGLIRNHYVGRTFIEPKQNIRNFGVKVKLNAVKNLIKGKRVIVIDDSIVRGTTSKKIVKMIKDSGAKEVHFRVSAPPTAHPCFYGIDTPFKVDLVAATHSIAQIEKFIGVDSLAYISIEGLRKALKDGENKYCKACFDGRYPVKSDGMETPQLGLFDK